MPTLTPRDISPPGLDEYNSYYHQYISLFQAENFLDGFAAQTGELQNLLGELSAEQVNKLHQPYTWTLKQVVGHLIDIERIFSTRALRIGVGDETPIPGIDQNIYVDGFDYETASMQDLLDEFALLRNANVMLARRMSDKALARRGTASETEVSAKANLYILAGHVVYHSEIVKSRQLSPAGFFDSWSGCESHQNLNGGRPRTCNYAKRGRRRGPS